MRLLGAVLGIAAATVSCGVDPSKRLGPTDAERRFGPAPPRDGSITYQPDVVLVDGGAEAIRSVSLDGITWTIDPGASNAREVVPGKIMFATGRAVGRVLAVRKTPDGLAVTVGPVALTEVIRDIDMKFEQTLDLQKAIRYDAPEFPGTAVSSSGTVSSFWPATDMQLRPAAFATRGPDLPFRLLPAVARTTSDPYGRFFVSPFANAGGLGLNLTTDSAGVRIAGGFVLYMNAPRLEVELQIKAARIEKAVVRLHGAASLVASFEAASIAGGGGNFTETITLPIDFSLLDGVPPPFAVTLRQAFTIRTMFSAPGSLKAKASFAVDGAIKLGYDGGWSPGGLKITMQQNLMDSIQGFSIGANGLVLTHRAKLIVGIGAAGFVAGPYVGVNSSFGAALGSRIGISKHTLLMSDEETCRGATFVMHLVGGVGYAIPKFVADAINTFLSGLSTILRTDIPRIKDQDGIEMKPWELPGKFERVQPSAQYCHGDVVLDQTR